jgi:glutamine amidotransferase
VIAIIDSGMGNCASVLNMLRRIGAGAKLTNSPDEVRAAQKLILPGIGAFDAGMAALQRGGLNDAICHALRRARRHDARDLPGDAAAARSERGG